MSRSFRFNQLGKRRGRMECRPLTLLTSATEMENIPAGTEVKSQAGALSIRTLFPVAWSPMPGKVALLRGRLSVAPPQ